MKRLSRLSNLRPPKKRRRQKTATLNDVLVLKINQDSWIDIKDANKKILISKTLKAGTVETFVVAIPASLKIGNIKGVEGTFRGQPLDLTTGVKTNMLRLKLQ